MARRVLACLLTCMLSAAPVLLSHEAEAAWIESLGQSARATAMGNAYIGVADDLSAVWYNPAGLTQLIDDKKVDQVMGVSLTTLSFTIDQPVSSPQTNGSHYSSDMPSNVPFVRSSMGIQITDWCYIAPIPIYITFAGATKYSETQGDARFSGYFVSELFLDWMPTVAFKLHKRLSVGIGLNVNAFNQIKLQNKLGDGYLIGAASEIVGEELANNLAPFFMDGQDDGKLLVRTDSEFPTGIKPVNSVDINFRDFGFRVGLHWTPLDWLRVGVNYRSEMRVHAEGEVSLIVNPHDPLVQLTRSLQGTPLEGLLPRIEDDTKRFELVFPLPAQVGFGFALQPTDWLLWSVDYTWTDWGHARKVDDLFVQDGGLGPTQITRLTVPRNWESVHSVRTGVEVRIAPKVFVQAGFWYDPSPASNEVWDVGTGMKDYFIYSVGAGLHRILQERLDIDLFFQYLRSSTRHVKVGESMSAGGTKYYSDPAQGAASNDDFSMVVEGQVISWGLDFTLHF